jgi:DNA-binding CsgD family transcriptional regulator
MTVTSGVLPASLTAVEVAIVSEIARGKTYAEIADEFETSAANVGNHLVHVRHKLHSRNTVQAAVRLAKAGLI